MKKNQFEQFYMSQNLKKILNNFFILDVVFLCTRCIMEIGVDGNILISGRYVENF